MSLYRLDDSVRQLLRLQNFASADFSTQEFIEKLSATQKTSDQDELSPPANLDPKPYIRLFETVNEYLNNLLEDARRNEAATEKSVSELSNHHRTDVLELGSHVEHAVTAARDLDVQTSELSTNLSSFGDRLDRVFRQHERVSRLKQLVNCYLQFRKRGKSVDLARLWGSGIPGDRRNCAHLVGQLQLLVRKITAATKDEDARRAALRVEAEVDKYAEELETNLIEVFQHAYDSLDFQGMREVAEILHDLNGGSNVIQLFVNQHDLFITVEKVSIADGYKNIEGMWGKMSKVSEFPSEFDNHIKSFIDEMQQVVILETTVVTRVFPKPEPVLAAFVQRLFAQKIQGTVTTFLQDAEQYSALAYVRALYVCYSRVKEMVVKLREAWASGLDKVDELVLVLDQSFNDTFVLFLDSYFTAEIKSLQETALGIIERTPKAQSGKDRAGAGASTVAEEKPNTNNPADEEDEEEGSRIDKIMRAVRLDRLDISRRVTNDEERILSAGANKANSIGVSAVDMSLVQLVLSACGEAVAREQVLRESRGVSDAMDFFNILIKDLCQRHINTSLSLALAYANQQVKQEEVDFSFLECVHHASNAVRLVSAFIQTVLFALVRENDRTLREMSQKLNNYVSDVEQSIARVVKKAADVVRDHITTNLNRQHKKDFSPRHGDGIDLNSPSLACRAIWKMLKAFEDQVSQCLAQANKKLVLNEVGTNLCNQMLSNIRRHVINVDGGRILQKDVNLLGELVLSWDADLSDHWTSLRAIVDLLACEPHLIASKLRGSVLSRLRRNCIQEFIMLRADYSSRNLSNIFLRFQ